MACSLLAGKVALVTGGFRGIGYHCVKELLEQGVKGVTIIDLGLDYGQCIAEKLNDEYGCEKCIAIEGDVTNPQQLEGSFTTTLQKFKGLDILINNAGTLKEQYWENVINTNTIGTVAGCLLAIKHMGKNNGKKGGTVINMASIVGLQPFAGCPVYCGTKHFIIGFTRSISDPFWWNLTGIKFMVMCPGVTDTAMIQQAGEFTFPQFPTLGPEAKRLLASWPPQKSERVSEGVTTMLNFGENGSIWVSEGNEVYEVAIPNRQTLRKTQGTF